MILLCMTWLKFNSRSVSLHLVQNLGLSLTDIQSLQ